MPVPSAPPKATTPPLIRDKELTVTERPPLPQPIPATNQVSVLGVPERPAPASVSTKPVPSAPATVSSEGSVPVPPAPPKTRVMIRDKDLMRLVQRWSDLPDHVRKCVIMLLNAVDSSQNTPE